jgi:predicted GIY-YIG superfamily endonuclease
MGTLLTIKAYALTDANADVSAYIGKTDDLGRRLPEHVPMRKARPSDTATLSID